MSTRVGSLPILADDRARADWECRSEVAPGCRGRFGQTKSANSPVFIRELLIEFGIP